MQLIIRESDVEAWEKFKTLEPTNDELYTIIVSSKFHDEAWALLVSQNPSIEDLVATMKYSPDKRQLAAEILLKRNDLDIETLEAIVKYANSDEAASRLLKQNLTKEILKTIIRYSNQTDTAIDLLLSQTLENEDLVYMLTESNPKIDVWERLLQQAPSNEELITVISFSNMQDLAWGQLLKQSPSNEELMDLVHNYSETGRKQVEAAQIIIKQNPDIETLTHIIDNGILSDEAFELLMKKSPSSEDLNWLIWRGNFKVNEAADLSLKNNPNKQQLLEIFEKSDRKNEAAARLVEMDLDIHELTDLVLFSSNQKAQQLLSERVAFDRSKVNEEALYQEVKAKILNNPELLTVNAWHDGEKHCFGGWAITICAEAQEIEKQYSSEIAACLVLPNYTHLFFVDQETILKAINTDK